MDEWLCDGPDGAAVTVVLAHGAGAPMDSPFMDRMAHGLSRDGLRVVRFEFPYMQRRREGGRRGPPDAASKLMDAWREVIDRLGGGSALHIGGKSMGGRIASMIADEVGARGLICLGYPFHPSGRPDRLRTAHLKDLETATLIVQGECDALGSREEIDGYELSNSIRIAYLGDGDHSFKPRRSSGRTYDQNMDQAIEAVGGFVVEQ